MIEDGEPVQDHRVRGRRRHQPRAAARQGRRLSDQAAVHRRLGDRRGRRQHRRASTSTASSPSARSGGRRARPRLLRARRARADADRRVRRRSATSTPAASPAARCRSTPRRRARRCETQVAEPLGRPLLEAAHGVFTIAVATMTRAVKAVTTYRGRDPRDFVAQPLRRQRPGRRGRDRPRARRSARDRPAGARRLQRGRPAVLRRRARIRAHVVPARRGDLAARCSSATSRGSRSRRDASLAAEGHARASTLTRVAELRYAGQAYELTVRVPAGADRRRAARRRASTPSTSAPTATSPRRTRSTSSSLRVARARAAGAPRRIRATLERLDRHEPPRAAYFGPEPASSRRR